MSQTRLPADQALDEWFHTPLGRSLQAMEVNCLRGILPGLFGPVALQLGVGGPLELAATRIVLQHGTRVGGGVAVRGESCSLPFAESSIHLVVLDHTLECCTDPHQVLREVQRVLTPEGHVVVLGFNPFSLWGLWRLAGWHRQRAPWNGQFLALARLKDWLSLLDFEPTGGRMVYYRPPLTNETARDRLYFLEQAGDRWWPLAAAAYILVARKREAGMTLLRPRRRQRRSVRARLVEPATRGLVS